MATSAIELLPYDGSARFKRIWLRRLTVLLLLLVVAQGIWLLVGDRITNRFLLLLWQRQCLNYSQMPGRIMYLWAPPQSQLPSHLGNFTPQTDERLYIAGAMPMPIELAEVQARLSGKPASFFQQLASPVYLHGLRDAKGNEKRVSVYVLADNPRTWWTVCVVVHDLATLTTDPGAAKVSTATWPMPTGRATVVALAGQADPKDPTRFAVPISINDQRLIVTGSLNPDGSVTMTSTSGLDPADKKYTGELKITGQAPVAPIDPDGILLPTDDQ